MKRKKKLNSLPFLVTLGSAAFLTLVWGSLSWSQRAGLFAFEEIEILGNQFLPDEEYERTLGTLEGLSLGECSPADICLALESHPFVEAVRASRQFPNKIRVEIVERTPLALINMEPLVMVDRYGVVLPSFDLDDQFEVPTLSGFNPARELYPVGRKTVSRKVLEASTIVDQIKQEFPTLYENLSEVTLNAGDEFVFILSERPTQVVLGAESIWPKIHILKEFEQSCGYKNGLNHFRRVDLRYQNQIVTREWS